MSAALDRILPRLVGVKKNARGAQAQCPAHRDRNPSLGISTNAKGDVLLYCRAGCATTSVLAAIGLEPSDLFAVKRDLERERANISRERAEYARAPRATIEAFLTREIERQRDLRLERSWHDAPCVRSADVNAARARANALYGVQLAAIARYDWEGWSPHDSDPAWPMLFERAMTELGWRLHVFKNPHAPIWEAAPLPASLYPEAAELASRWLRAMARSDAKQRAAAA